MTRKNMGIEPLLEKCYGNMIGNKQFLFKFNLLMQIAYHILYIFQIVFNMYLQPPRPRKKYVCRSYFMFI